MIVVVALMGIPAAAARAQGSLADSASVERAAVQRARAVFAATNVERPTLRTVKRRIFGLSSEGAEALGLYRGGELRKIELDVCGSMGCGTEEMYLDGGTLIFVFEKNEIRHPLSHRRIRREEGRLYPPTVASPNSVFARSSARTSASTSLSSL